MDKQHEIVKHRLRAEGIRFSSEYLQIGPAIIDFIVNKKFAVILTNDDITNKIPDIEKKKLTAYKLRTDFMFEEDLIWLVEMCTNK